MFRELSLALWSGAGLLWWLSAWRLVSRDNAAPIPPIEPVPHRPLTVFKPLPPLGEKGLAPFAEGIESFVAALDPESELLLGIHEFDRAATGSFVARLRAEYPKARLKVIFRTEPDDVANPKIAWQKLLSGHAEGEWWLWSDADIVAPAGFLARARAEYAARGAAMLTFPYVVCAIPAPPALFEALFVNVEFFPGVLLLRERGAVDFGLGAGMLFSRDDFMKRVDWAELGAMLADDYFLGQKLGPVQVARTRVVTVAHSTTWKEALLHDLRWTKTIRWNRPGGSFARLFVLPVLGWLIYAVFHPAQGFGWLGLFLMMQADVLMASLISRAAGCPLPLKNLVALEAWSLWRVALWIGGWLPWPVVWSGKKWPGPRAMSQFARQREERI